jgi:hypothetical protein
VYSLVVQTADGRSSTEEGKAFLGFRLLTDDELAEVGTLVSRIDVLGLTDEARTLALAHVYLSRTYGGFGLTADAISHIEQLVQQGVRSPALYQLLGDLYQDIDLGHEARQAYEAALDLADETGDTAGQAVALFELGKLLSLGTCVDRLASVEPLERAAATYEQLGDLQQRDEVRTWIPTNLPTVCPTATPGP